MARLTSLIQRLAVLFSLLFLSWAIVPGLHGQELLNVEPRKWELDLGPYTRTCSNGTRDCQMSSPVIVDLDGSGGPEVLVATNKGFVIAIRGNGTISWVRDVAPAFGMSAGSQEIASSPAVGDIDGDGRPEIAVGVGHTRESCDPGQAGGVIVLEHNGAVKAGWPRISADENGNGCPDSVSSTPALGNLDGDAALEIAVGGFDKRVYAWNYNGTPVPGFPPDSHHLDRFPTWDNLVGRLADTIWSSPAIKDLNRDGVADVIIGSDEGNFDARFGGDAGGWSCPYSPPPGGTAGYCGGSLYALSGNGDLLPGFPRYTLETITSSPVVADLTNDGYPEVYVGAGTFYYNNSPNQPTYGFVLNGWDHLGNTLPGWPKQLGGAVPGSPVVGDIAGDAHPEIIVAAWDSRIYAFFHNGNPVPGFPMTPRRESGQTGALLSDVLVLGDYDGDGKDEIFVSNSWTITVVNGNGAQLTGDDFPSNSKPIYYAYGSLLNSPALGDIDGDGRLEMVVLNSKVRAFDLPAASSQASWPAFKGDPERDSEVPIAARADVSHNMVLFFIEPGGGQWQEPITIRNLGDVPLDWELDPPRRLSLSQLAGTLQPGQSTTVIASLVLGGLPEGTYSLGDLEMAISGPEGPVPGVPDALPVQILVGQVYRSFFPLMR